MQLDSGVRVLSVQSSVGTMEDFYIRSMEFHEVVSRVFSRSGHPVVIKFRSVLMENMALSWSEQPQSRSRCKNSHSHLHLIKDLSQIFPVAFGFELRSVLVFMSFVAIGWLWKRAASR